MDEWSQAELSAAVDGYMELLKSERDGAELSKSSVRERLLAGPLAGRSPGSIEYRMQNISAVLAGLGQPWVAGYKPAGNVGPTNTRRLRELIKLHDQPEASTARDNSIGKTNEPIKPNKVFVANFGKENFEWPRCFADHYVATMQDERVYPFWQAGDRDGYIDFAMRHLNTIKGFPPIRPVASRWFNLATVVVESENDLWLHRQGDLMWWTITTSEPVRIDRELDPTARSGEPTNGMFFRKPTLPWSNYTTRGNRLEWKALHPKSHDFFSTEATLQRLSEEYASYAVELINGGDLSPWTDQKVWREKAGMRAQAGRVLSRREIAVAMMVRRAMQTAAQANGQQVLRRVKNKEMRFASPAEFERYVSELMEAQEGLCALTGLEMRLDDREEPELCCSLDRKDSGGHYEPGNLQVVCRFANRWKSDGLDDEFRRLIRLVRSARN